MQQQKSLELLGMLAFIVVCAYWAFVLFTARDPWIPLDYGNFFIHEFGHILFIPFGEFWMMMGGSIFQILLPLLITIYFGYKRQFYAMAFCVFWVGDNVINVGRYVADARTKILPIIGGRHDWNWILSVTGKLYQDTQIANTLFVIGRIALVSGLFLMLIVTFISYIRNYVQR